MSQLSRAEIDRAIAIEIAAATQRYRDFCHNWPRMWLDAYYDPNISFEDNCKAAWAAVQAGWKP